MIKQTRKIIAVLALAVITENLGELIQADTEFIEEGSKATREGILRNAELATNDIQGAVGESLVLKKKSSEAARKNLAPELQDTIQKLAPRQ